MNKTVSICILFYVREELLLNYLVPLTKIKTRKYERSLHQGTYGSYSFTWTFK